MKVCEGAVIIHQDVVTEDIVLFTTVLENKTQEERFERMGNQNHYESKTTNKQQGKLIYHNYIKHKRCSEPSLKKYE